MSALVQLDLFRDVDEIRELRVEIQRIADSSANVRRGLFARHGELAKMCLELFNEVESLKDELYNLKAGVGRGLA